ncbi:hypothetical protein QCM77_37235 [Bradyrhizobium sp. SSUT18]|nr:MULTISPECIES: DUF296 domain-containing protein [unclassified Bradyrhizobium]MDH2347068.1 hypothetical protein [Bradyrhizobium sp. SSUT77]MDH2356297.1 hypothetical protein [Bradyrhizobium sp. SSUT112]MDH2405496.1 hypothetical protein [Bradyrhizobium sp. SSUT18]
MLSLLGDVAQGDDGKASLHLHAVLGLQHGTLRGGHLLSGSAQPTIDDDHGDRGSSAPKEAAGISVSR